MSMYKQFQTDLNREQAGIWVNYSESFKVLIARAGGSNKAFHKRLEVLTREYRRAISTGTMDPELAEDLMRRAYAETVILGWKVKQDGEWVDGIESPDEALLPVTPENIAATLKALPELYADIREQATSMVMFREALREEAAGN